MKDITKKGIDGKKSRTVKTVQLEKSEFLLLVKSVDGREVAIVFHCDGSTIIRADDSAKLEHN